MRSYARDGAVCRCHVVYMGRAMERRRVDKGGDFSAYVAARGKTLIRSAVLMGCSPQDAEDLAQTALMRCYTSWDKVQSARDVDAYVYRVLFNCLSTGRRRRWRGETPTAVPPDGTDVDATERLAVALSVREALRGMTLEHRSVLVLKYFADLTDGQVAEALSVPVGTVKSRLARALLQLSHDRGLVDLSDNGSTP